MNTVQELSRAQHLIWLAQSVAQDVPLYNLVVTYAIKGDLDVQRFVQSLEALVASSDILQSQLINEESELPSQQRNTSIKADCELLSMASHQELDDWAAKRSAVPLDPRQKMFDCAVVSLPDNSHVFYWCQHHISTDGFNIALMLSKLSSIYTQLGEGAAPVIDIPSYYAFLQAQREDNPRRNKIEQYWREKIAQKVEEPQYFGQAFDHSHAKVRNYIELTREQREAIDAMLLQPGFKSIGRDMSLFSLMSAAMLVTGYRLHRHTELHLGFPAHGRQTPEDRETLGMFTAIGFLDLALDSSDSFRELARRIMREAMKSFSHIEAGVQTKESQQAYASSVNVLTADITHFADLPVDVQWRYVGFSDSNSQLDLNINDFAGNGEFELSVDLASSVFTKQYQQTYVDTFNTVLDALLQNPDQRVSEFEIIDAQAREALLAQGTGAAAQAIQPNTLHAHFAQQVEKTPDALAVKDERQQLTFTQLDKQSNAIASYLAEQGVQAGDAVGICFKRSVAMYPAMLAVMKVGAAMVPLDPTYPSDRLAYMVKNSGASLVLSDKATSPSFDLGSARLEFIDNEALQNASTSFTARTPAANDALYIMYTSGSTGLPKGVIGTHAATLNRFAWMWRSYPFQSDEVCCQKTALSFVDSIWELFGPLLQGVPVVVIPESTVLDIFAFIDTLEAERISRLVVVPSFLSVMLESDVDVSNRLRTLEYCIVSGEPLPLHVARGFLNQLGQCKLLNLYGSTEVTADVTFDEVSHDKLGIKMPIGKPIDGVSVVIVDDQMKLLPAGAVGEIGIAGAALSGGYYDSDELNREKFMANPFGDGQLFKTGDLGRFRHNGLLEHHGRRDAQIKIRGHRIESAEIENAMLDYKHVRSAVLYVGDNDQLYGFYVVSPGELVDERALTYFLKSRLPEYMLPQPVAILQMPLLGNGKINRAALGQLTPQQAGAAQSATAPRTPTEEILVALWQHTLGLSDVDIHADFFDLGGNSIAAMRIMVGARKQGIALSLKEILDIGNVAQIGVEIDSNPLIYRTDAASAQKSEDDAAAQTTLSRAELAKRLPGLGGEDNIVDAFPLTAAQKGILFHLLLHGTQAPLYMAQVRCDLHGGMDVALFQQAWNRALQRHDMLRSVVVHEGLEEPLQVIAKHATLEIDVHDLKDKSESDARAACDVVAAAGINKPIAIDAQPMMRMHLGLIDNDTTHFMLEWHHILMDGWSLAILANEALLSYVASVEGAQETLLEVGRFKEHVGYLSSQDSEMIQAFWRDNLKGFTAPTSISKKEDKAADLYAKGNKKILVDKESTERLYEFSRKCRVTPNSIVQAAWALLLAKYNNTDDVVFGFAVTGRSSGISNFESTVGMFVNSLPMRIKCGSDTTLYDWVQAIQQSQFELIEHENSSLTDIQSASEMPSNAPMFDSLMVFQNAPKLTLSNNFAIEITNRSVHENSPTPITVEIFPEELLEIQVMYIEEVFEAGAVDQIISHFTNIINSITLLETSAKVSDIGMMSLEEIQHMTESFNQTARDYRKDQHVADVIWERAAMHPDRVAATFGDVSYTYQEVVDRADILATELQSRGIGANAMVGVCLFREPDLLIAMLAVQRAGAAYIPLDPDYPQDRIDAILADGDVALLVTKSDVAAAAQSTSAPLLRLDEEWAAIEAAQGELAKTFSVAPNNGDDVAYVIYTSGSTGKPKGVKVTRWNLMNFLYSMIETPGMTEDDRILAVTTVSFDLHTLELFLPLMVGARTDVAPRDLTFDGAGMAARIKEQGITYLEATPTTWRLLLAAGWEGVKDSDKPFKALIGGEPLPRDLAAALIPRVSELWNMYGPSESTVWCTAGHVTDADALITIGKPIANTQIIILDGNDKLCPMSIPGELCVAGDGITLGYVDRPELTAEKFVPHPLKPGSGELIYRSGDLARWTEDGELECLGRIDSQIKLRGFRIELGEIESVLGEVEGIDYAVVKLIEHPDNKFLAAYMLADANHDDIAPNEPSLRAQLREKLPIYMVPSTFMYVDDMPRMPNGKIDRKALPDPSDGDGNMAQAANIDVFDLPENQPATDTERTLSELWEKGLDKKQLSVNSNFFDLGGNSITAMQIASLCTERDIELSILEIFELGTIRQCAQAVDQATGAEPAAEPEATVQHSSDDMARIAAMLKGGK